VDIYHFGIIARSMTRNGSRPKYQLACSFRPIDGLDSWSSLVIHGLGRSWLVLISYQGGFFVFVLHLSSIFL
jgi:hypothetical protein